MKIKDFRNDKFIIESQEGEEAEISEKDLMLFNSAVIYDKIKYIDSFAMKEVLMNTKL